MPEDVSFNAGFSVDFCFKFQLQVMCDWPYCHCFGNCGEVAHGGGTVWWCDIAVLLVAVKRGREREKRVGGRQGGRQGEKRGEKRGEERRGEEKRGEARRGEARRGESI